MAFEGIDGSGKSTLTRLVAARLRRRGRRVVLTQEPTKTWLGQAVRRGIRRRLDPLALCGLFLADRGLHVATLVPALARGDVVLTDRYMDSTSAYQGAALADRVPRALELLDIAQRALFPDPDLVVLLDVAPRTALARIHGRAVKEPFERARFLEKVRKNYLALSQKKRRRWLVVDAGRPRRELADEVAAAVEARLG